MASQERHLFSKESFKKDYATYGPEKIEKQLPHLTKLVTLYQQRAENNRGNEGNWLNYVKAHAIANSCLIRDKHNTIEWQERIYEIEESFYQGKHPLTRMEHRELTRTLKQQLQYIRDRAWQAVEPLDSVVKRLDGDQESTTPQNRAILEKMMAVMYPTSKSCSEDMIELSAAIVRASEKIIKKQHKAASNYCVAAMGSTARGEATPYSDLEYFIIVPQNDDFDEKYFCDLAVDTYFRMTNFGETRLNYLYIEELHDVYQQDGKADERWFEDHARNGFKVDGFLPHSGHIPTGNGLPEGTVLIRTPEELADLYKAGVAQKADSKMRGGFADLLHITSIIHSNGKGEELWNEFQQLIIEHERTMDRSEWMQKMAITMLRDMNTFDYAPSLSDTDDRQRKVKIDIFRFPTLMLFNFKMGFGVNTIYPWEDLDGLQKSGLISDDEYWDISVLLATALYTRLSAYLNFKSQKEEISIWAVDDADQPKDKYYIPLELFIIMAMAMLKVKTTYPGQQRENTSALAVIFSKKGPPKARRRAEVLMHCGQSERGMIALKQDYDISEDIYDQKNFSKALNEKCGDDREEFFVGILIIALCLYEAGYYETSNHYYQYFLDETKGDSFFTAQQSEAMLMLARNHYGLEHYDATINICHEFIEICGKQTNHPGLPCAHEVLGSSYEREKNYELAEKYCLKALELYAINGNQLRLDAASMTLATVYIATKAYHEAEEICLQTLERGRKMFGLHANHQLINTAHHRLGVIYSHTNRRTEAKYHNDRNAEFTQKFYGEGSKHPNLYISYLNAGWQAQIRGDYKKAKEQLTEGNRAVLAIESNNKEATASTHYALGVHHQEKREHAMALYHYEIALKLLMDVHGRDSSIDGVILIHHGMGKVFLNIQRFAAAERHLKITIDMHIRNGVGLEDPKMALAYQGLGHTYAMMGKHELADQYLHKALQIFVNESGDHSCDHRLAATHHTLGRMYMDQGHHIQAFAELLKSVTMLECIYGYDPIDPRRITARRSLMHCCATSNILLRKHFLK